MTSKGEKYFEIGEVIRAFETLINCDATRENQLEEFIKINFMVILGKEYSQVKTQIMVNYFSKESCEERRFDVFAFNSISKEWELFELKKSNIKIVKKIRGIPMFNSNANDGIAQLRYYKNLVIQEHIRKSLKEKHEIDIGVPKFTLLIGSGNDSDLKICQSEVVDVKVETYSQLIEKAKCINK